MISITQEAVQDYFSKFLIRNNPELWAEINNVYVAVTSDKFLRAECCEKLFVAADSEYNISIKKFTDDPAHYFDLKQGDICNDLFGINIDLKLGDKYAGAISMNSLENFYHWYLCMPISGKYGYLLKASYLRELFACNKLVPFIDTATGEKFLGELNCYRHLVDNKNVFYIS